MELSSNRNKWLVNLFIILLAVSPAFALGDNNRNLLLIGVMFVTPIFLFIYFAFIPKIDIPLITVCALMMILPPAFHPLTVRWSTVLYSCMFALYFMSFVRVLNNSSYTLKDFSNIIRILIFAYCIVLLIQQFCVLTGLPIFNVSNYDPRDPWKLNSLTAEPSHAARILPLLMYMYVTIQKRLTHRYTLRISLKDKWVWGAFLWTLITMHSATSFIFLPIILAQLVSWRSILPLLIPLVFIGGLMMTTDFTPAVRARKVIIATLTLDEKEIIKADHSASSRIVPTIQAAKLVGVSDVDDWVGHGVDADYRMIKPIPGTRLGSAGAFQIWFNYGLLAALVYWSFSLSVVWNRNWISLLFWFLLVFIYGGMNNQVIWLVLVLFYTYKHSVAKMKRGF